MTGCEMLGCLFFVLMSFTSKLFPQLVILFIYYFVFITYVCRTQITEIHLLDYDTNNAIMLCANYQKGIIT